MGCLTQYINFISGETLTYRIVPTDEESGTVILCNTMLWRNLNSQKRLKSTEGATSHKKDI